MLMAPPNASAPPRYAEWLAYLFDREVTDPAWYHSMSPGAAVEFEAEPIVIAELFIHTMRNCMRDLARYSDSQVKLGIQHIICCTCGNVAYTLSTKATPKPLRADVVDSISTLYADCFTPRCAPVLGHLDEPGHNPINSVCYMFWDISPFLSGNRATVLSVLESALNSPNRACQESALHGLGHLRQLSDSADDTTDLIDAYIRKQRPSGPLRTYADRAIRGDIA